MKNGNIGNRECPILAFNIDSLLFNEKENKDFFEIIKSKIIPKKSLYLERPLNKEFVYTIENIWRDFPYSVYFITQHPFTDEIELFLIQNCIPFTSLKYFEDLFDLRKFVELRCIYYFDKNETILSFISLRNALPFTDLNKVLRR